MRIRALLVVLVVLLVRASSAVCEDTISGFNYTCSGTSIIKDFESPSGLCRYTFSWDRTGDIYVYYMDVYNEKQLMFKADEYYPSLLESFGSGVTYPTSIYVECQSPWSLTVEKLKLVDKISFSDIGNATTDMFTLSDDVVVGIDITPRDSSRFIVGYRCYSTITDELLDQGKLMDETVSKRGSYKFILNKGLADQRVFFMVETSADVAWRIYAE